MRFHCHAVDPRGTTIRHVPPHLVDPASHRHARFRAGGAETPGPVGTPKQLPSGDTIIEFRKATPDEDKEAIAVAQADSKFVADSMKVSFTELQTDHFIIFNRLGPARAQFLEEKRGVGLHRRRQGSSICCAGKRLRRQAADLHVRPARGFHEIFQGCGQPRHPQNGAGLLRLAIRRLDLHDHVEAQREGVRRQARRGRAGLGVHPHARIFARVRRPLPHQPAAPALARRGHRRGRGQQPVPAKLDQSLRPPDGRRPAGRSVVQTNPSAPAATCTRS